MLAIIVPRRSLVLIPVVIVLLSIVVNDVSSSDNNFVEYYIREELPVNELVGNLVRDFGLDQLYSPLQLTQLRFTFLTQPAAVGVPDRPYFAIDERTGDIFVTSNRLDRDKICPRLDYCVVQFDVAVQPIEFFQIIKVKVEIMDDNDNAPVFPDRKISHEISELAEPGTAFVVPAASDLDSGRNAVYRYDVVPRDGKFELTSRATADGGTDLRLVLRDRLDRETEDRYLVTVLAIDGGDPPKTGSILVNVSVLDANDNNPQFENSSYEVWVTENVPVGTIILRLKARDRDAGQNAAIVYEFSKHTAEEYGHLFGIKSETGKIYVKNNLDFETGSVYLLSITASDRGPDSLPAHASVIVRVEDVNDHGPQISINTLTTSGIAEVRENSDVGTFVAHLSVVDADSADNGRFLCAVDDNHFTLEQLYPSELKLVTAAVLDREQRESYDLSISCRDFGAAPLSSIVPLWVKVSDDNDHAPQFGSTVYESRIEENNPIGVRLFHVTATDPDAGQNGQIVYRVDAGSLSFVRVDSTTGEVSAAAPFDREAFDQLTVRLTAEDRGDPPLSTSIELRLTIIDTDDNGPTFDLAENSGGRFSMRIVENRPSGSEVGTVTAVDLDLAPFDRFSYSLDRRHDSFDSFDIDSKTGLISTKEILDRERQARYRLVVIVRPDSGTAPSGTAIVDIEVGDVNDCDPVFQWPTSGNETLAISSRTPRGHVIARLRANDRDTGVNANLTYYLVWSEGGPSVGVGAGGSSTSAAGVVPPRQTPFVVVPDTGAVVVAADLSTVSMETFVFRATVRDGGNRFDHAFLRIVVSKDILFVPSSGALTDFAEHNGHLGLLASEDMVVVLAFTLAVIIIAIIVIVIVILALRRRTSGSSDDIGGGVGRRRQGRGGFAQSWGGGMSGGRAVGNCCNEEKMQLSGPRAVYDVDRSCSNGTLAYCNGSGSHCSTGNGGKCSTTMTTTDYNGGSLLAGKAGAIAAAAASSGNGFGNKYAGSDTLANGNGSFLTKLPTEADMMNAAMNKATAVVNAYKSLDMTMVTSPSDDDLKSHVTCIAADRQTSTQGYDTTSRFAQTWHIEGAQSGCNGVNNNCVPDLCAAAASVFDDRVVQVSEPTRHHHVRSSATTADLNHITLPSSFRTSWQSLTMNEQPKGPVVVFIRDQAELFLDDCGPTVDPSSDPFQIPVGRDSASAGYPQRMNPSSSASGYSDHAFRPMSSYGTLPLSMTSSRHNRAAQPIDDGFDYRFQTPSATSVYQHLQPLPTATVGSHRSMTSPTTVGGVIGGFSMPLQVGNGIVR